MTGVRLHHSNRMEALAGALVRTMRAGPGEPIAPERIVVPHPTIARWLSLELASELGIAANIRFEQPAEFAWSVMRAVVPDLPRDQPYTPSRLRWRIHDLLPEFAGEGGSGASHHDVAGRVSGSPGSGNQSRAWEGAVSGYLRDGDPRKRLELADRLARVFDQCLLYRKDWIEAWERGETPHWQARLWQHLIAMDGPEGATHWVRALRKFTDEFRRRYRDGDGVSPTGGTLSSRATERSSDLRAEQPAFPARLAAHLSGADADRRPAGWPRRVSLFAVPALSSSYLEFLGEAAWAIDIHLFLLNPCREYWGDIHSRREIGHRAKGADPDSRYLTEGNELLAAWGRAGRDGFDALVDIPDAEWEEHFEVPSAADRLAAVQRDILDLRLAEDAAQEDALGGSTAGGHDAVHGASTDTRGEREPAGREGSRGAVPTSEGASVSEIFPGSLSDEPAAVESLDGATRSSDDSLQIHVCHSPVREAEVLHDRLLAIFDAHPDLQPADVLVLTPDLEVYGPAIEAVFAAAGRIRCNVTRARMAESRTMRAFLELLALPGSRHAAKSVLSPLAAPAVRTRFGMGEADVATIRDWVRDAGIRWGVDERHRGEEGLPATADHTWRHGLRRLLLGYAVSDAGEPIAGLVPCAAGVDGFDGDMLDGELLGRFVSYCEKVFELRAQLGGRRRPAGWGAVLRDAIRDFLVDGSEPIRSGDQSEAPWNRALARDLAEETAAVRGLVRDFEFETANAESPVPIEVVRDVLREKSDAGTHGTARLADGASVAGLGLSRVFPAAVVCVVGMNDGVFPRSPSAPSFDVIATGRARRGDRDVRYDDRFAFLEALLAARRCFLVTYSGRGLRDDTAIPPSVLVDELKDYLHRRFPGEMVETRHPLQPFSPRYFVTGGPQAGRSEVGDASAGRIGAGQTDADGTHTDAGLFSYSRGMCEAARIVRARPASRESSPRFTNAELPEPDESRRSVDLSELSDFFANPTRFFFRDRLGVRLELDDLSLEDEEPFKLDNLERYQLRTDIWDQIRAGIEPERGAALLRGSGRLPQEGLGRYVQQQAREEVEPLEAVLAPDRSALDAEPRAVDVELDGFRLVGAIEHVEPAPASSHSTGVDEAQPARMVWWRIGSLRARDRIVIRIRQLAWMAAGHGPLAATVVWLERGEWQSATFPPPHDAHEELGYWLRARWQGLAAPLPVFPETSLAFAEAIAKAPDDGDAVREVAREKARIAWFGDQCRRGEVLDPYRALVYEERDPLTDEFEELATMLLVPLAASQP